MEITFDTAKDTVNIAKHGVSLALAVDLEWDTLRGKPDNRCDYGEMRMIGYALIGSRLRGFHGSRRRAAPHHQPAQGER